MNGRPPGGPLRGFFPVVTFRYPLDALLTPYIDRFCPGALISVTELRHRQSQPWPQGPLMIDSGGFAALDPANRVEEEDGLGVLLFADGSRLTPQYVHAAQASYAHTGFTLDFPTPESLGEVERRRRWRLGEANARWALQQPRTFGLYACVQPGQDSAPLMAMNPDGLALGGLVPFAADRSRLLTELGSRLTETAGRMPIHVFGIGHPESVRQVLAAGASSCDSSSAQQYAVNGRTFHGTHLADATPPERLRLALANLLSITSSPVPLHLQPNWQV